MGLQRLLVANRGEIAVRIIQACRAEGIETVLAASSVDMHSMPAQMADRVVCIGPGPSHKSYTKANTLVAAALGTHCDALHPGYGFLSENAHFAELCAQHGICFVGPRAQTIQDMGNKIHARACAKAAGVPTVPGFDDIADYHAAESAAQAVGLPLLLKAAAGGGGRGMQVVRRMADLRRSFETASAEAFAAFGDGTLYIERFIEAARHIEVQIIGDGRTVLHVGERDCTLQRRHQKVVEEGPAEFVDRALIDAMRASAVKLARSVNYESVGTVEFIYDKDKKDYFFLEMNTRIQVEHRVTELLTGMDLVRAQLQIAGGTPLALAQADIAFDGHVIECRINAENPKKQFRPSPGKITKWLMPEGDGILIDTYCRAGTEVPPFYDSLLAKLVVRGADRAAAIRLALDALDRFQVEGVDTTIPYIKYLLGHPDFATGNVNTRWIESQLANMDL